MRQYHGSSQTGTREFLQSHRATAQESAEDPALNGVKTHLTAVTFDNMVEVATFEDATAITDAQIEECVRKMAPRNTTRLFDTSVEQIEAQAQRMKGKQDEGKMVHAVFALLTDGTDNESWRNRTDLSQAIADHEARGVECMFVQAGTNAMEVGRQYGFAAERTLEMGNNPEHAQNAMRAISGQSTQFARGASRAVTATTDATMTAPASIPETRMGPAATLRSRRSPKMMTSLLARMARCISDHKRL